MSAAWTAWAWEQNLAPKAKLILLAIADQMPDTGVAVLDAAQLARRTNISQAGVTRTVSRVSTMTDKGNGKLVVQLNAINTGYSNSSYSKDSNSNPSDCSDSYSKDSYSNPSYSKDSKNYSSSRMPGSSQELDDIANQLSAEIKQWRKGERW